MANIRDLAVGTIATAPSPASSGTTLTLQSGEGADMPATPFYLTTASLDVPYVTKDNAESLYVTDVTNDTLTITRAQGDTVAQSIATGWIVVNPIRAADIITDHGGLTGLVDDSHSQYALADGTRGSFATAAQGTLADSAAQPSDLDGKVTGAASATDNALARYDSTTGKLVQDSNVRVDDVGNIQTDGKHITLGYIPVGPGQSIENSTLTVVAGDVNHGASTILFTKLIALNNPSDSAYNRQEQEFNSDGRFVFYSNTHTDGNGSWAPYFDMNNLGQFDIVAEDQGSPGNNYIRLKGQDGVKIQTNKSGFDATIDADGLTANRDIVLQNSSGTLALTSDVTPKANDSAVVHNTGDETVAGVKTFSSSPVVPAPTTDTQASTKKYVDDSITAAGGYNDEAAQDAIGTILTDSSEIDFTYDDASPSITAIIKPASIDETKLDTSVNASLDLADTATQPGDLATVATTGVYSDLTGTPDLTALNDVVTEANLAAFPTTGDSDFVYIAEDTGYMYRWNGTDYTQLTDQTAIWGQVSGTLSNQTDLQSALDGKLSLTGGTLTGSLTGTSATFTQDSKIEKAVGNVNLRLGRASTYITLSAGDANADSLYMGNTKNGQTIYWPGDNFRFIAPAATSVSTIKNATELEFYGRYWNGTASVDSVGEIKHIIEDTAGNSRMGIFEGGSERLSISSAGIDVTGNIAATGTVDGRDVGTDGTRLDAITDANYLNSNTTRANVGLANVDNTSDATKPVSVAQQTALDAKAPLASPTFTGTVTLPASQVVNGVTLSTAESTTNFLRGDGTYAAPAGGGTTYTPLNTLTVASSTASTAEKASADYTCDGTADEVQINAALTALGTSGGIVQLSKGTFNLSATIAVTGDGTTADSGKYTIKGTGPDSTQIDPATGIHGFTISESPKFSIQDISINLLGTSDGIRGLAGTVGDKRGFWMSEVINVQFQGDNSTHSGWCMNLDNPFRSSFRNLQGLNVKNGIWLKSSNSSFNPGNLVFEDCHMDLGIANGTAYFLDTADTGGFVNICTFIECDAIDSNGSSTTSIGWRFKGSTTTYYTTRDVLVLRSNVELFNTAVSLEHSANIEFNGNYIDTKSSGTIFNVSSDSPNNQLSAQYVYVPSPKTTKILNDLNTDPLKPTTLRNSFARVETGGTLSLTKTVATVLTGLYRDSDGTGVYPTEWQAQTTPLVVKDEATELFRGTKSIDFTGAGVTATNTAGDVTVTIPGGGGGTVDVVSNVATSSILGRTTAGSGDSEELTAAQTRTLLNVANGATANDTDANLKARANHTGTQTASTISDFDTEVSNNTDVAANTAKVTNATHTGDVTGDTALTIAANAVTPAKMQGTSPTSSKYYRGDGTWNTPTNTTYSEITTAEIDAGTAATLRTVTGRRAAYMIGKVTATSLGLGSVDNTSDANKPVSTAQQTALDAKAIKTETMGTVVHGATAGTARPTGYAAITWIGSVEPTNATNNDVWYDNS